MRADDNTRDSFNVIKHYDPELYAKMVAASKWRVIGDVEPDKAGRGYGVTGVIKSVGQEITDGLDVHAGDALTEIDVDQINEASTRYGVNPVNFLADVLVHEFAHTPDGGQSTQDDNKMTVPELESPAFTAGTAFAKKMGGFDGALMAKLSESTRKAVDKQGGYNFS